MSAIGVSLPKLEYAIREVSRCLEQNNTHRPKWDAMNENDLWRELVACILGSRVRFDVAHAAIERMDKAGLFSSAHRFLRSDEYEHDILRVLAATGKAGEDSGLQGRYPFPRLRAKQIRTAAGTLYADGGTIRRLLQEAHDMREVRRRLSADVAGLGPKQASLFLRNVGYAIHVAVLDIHVLTYMNWIGLTPSLLKTIRTVRQYEMLEDAFVEHSCSAGFPPSLYDVAVWVVVRVAKKEPALCR